MKKMMVGMVLCAIASGASAEQAWMHGTLKPLCNSGYGQAFEVKAVADKDVEVKFWVFDHLKTDVSQRWDAARMPAAGGAFATYCDKINKVCLPMQTGFVSMSHRDRKGQRLLSFDVESGPYQARGQVVLKRSDMQAIPAHC